MKFTSILLLFLLGFTSIALSQSVYKYLLSAEKGDAKAQYNLGFMYNHGIDVAQDYTEASKWFRKAAEKGNAKAQYNLGLMYDNGEGLPEDFVYAYKWINLAAAQGHEKARSAREIIVKKMTKEQISEAQKLSSEWFKKNAEKLR